MQRRPPGRIAPIHQSYHKDEQHILYGQTPVAKSRPGHRNSHAAGNDLRDDGDDAALAIHQVDEEIGALNRAQATEEETQEEETAQPQEIGVVIVVYDKGGTEEEEEVKDRPDAGLAPEDGIIVAMSAFHEVA